jgi:hypothetical protein
MASKLVDSGPNQCEVRTMTKICMLLVVCASLLSLGAYAQDSNTSGKGKASTRTVTGCLTKGDSANEFLLTASDGSTWEVRSSQVSLADHVGHTVSATGVVSHAKMHNMKEDAKDAAQDSGMKKSNTEHGHMTITDVQMVSSSCQQ